MRGTSGPRINLEEPMKPSLTLLGCLASSFCWGSLACAGKQQSRPASKAPSPAPITISVIGTTDVHGHVSPKSLGSRDGTKLEIGGSALLAGYLNNLATLRGDRIVLLDGGDLFQGTLISNHSDGRPVIEIMNELGYDAAAVGNHEFDWGRKILFERSAEARFPLLAANIFERSAKSRPAWPNIHPWTLIERAGIKIGLLGLATRDTPTYARAGTFDDVEFHPLAETVKAALPKLRKAGAQLIFVVAHEGGACKRFDAPRDLSSCFTEAKIFKLANALEPGSVDLIVGGHTHQQLAHVVNGTPILQAGAKGRAFVRADLVVDPTTGKLLPDRLRVFPPQPICSHVEVKGQGCANQKSKGPIHRASYAGGPVHASAAIATLLAPYEAKVNALRKQSIDATAATELSRSYDGESELGNLISDSLLLAVPGAHVGLQNSGGIRAEISPGPITFGQVFDVLPFGNKIATIRLSGAQLKQLLWLGSSGEHGLNQIAGLQVVVDRSLATCGGTEAIVSATFPDGSALKNDGSYLVVTNDYLARGGSGYDKLTSRLPNGAVQVLEDRLTRDAAIDHLKRLGHAIDSREQPLLNPAKPRVTIRNRKARIECP